MGQVEVQIVILLGLEKKEQPKRIGEGVGFVTGDSNIYPIKS
jgi:hypothetical protein